MNRLKIQKLLEQWGVLLVDGKQVVTKKASQTVGGLKGRIRRTTGTPVIFDFETYDNQKEIQNSLCEELSQFADLIKSVPEIMDGYSWTRGDFIELYFKHYALVIEKIKRLTEQSADM